MHSFDKCLCTLFVYKGTCIGQRGKEVCKSAEYSFDGVPVREVAEVMLAGFDGCCRATQSICLTVGG